VTVRQQQQRQQQTHISPGVSKRLSYSQAAAAAAAANEIQLNRGTAADGGISCHLSEDADVASTTQTLKMRMHRAHLKLHMLMSATTLRTSKPVAGTQLSSQAQSGYTGCRKIVYTQAIWLHRLPQDSLYASNLATQAAAR
jgi:hypothetical protein